MPDHRLEDLLALHAHLVTLEAAGVSLDLGFKPGSMKQQLRDIEGEVSRRVARRATLPAAFDGDRATGPPGYRRLVVEWLAGADLAEALEASRRVSEQTASYRTRLTIRLLYPAMVVVFACVGLAIVGRQLTPVFESAYGQLDEPVGHAVARLQWLQRSAPVWLVVGPLLVAAGVWLLRRWPPLRITRGGRPRGPASRRRLAQQSAETAMLFKAGEPRPEALRIVHTARTGKEPPLLRWAEASGSASDLNAVGTVYNRLALQGAERAQTYLPIVAVVLVGGGVTLFYAVALFTPLIEFLQRMAR